MGISGHFAHAAKPDEAWPRHAIGGLRRRPIDLLRKILWIALHLISIRVVSVVGLVIALWLCPVQLFADLGFYLAAVNLAAIAVFGRFELLIVSAREERQCADAMHLCILTATGAVLIILMAATAVHRLFPIEVILSFSGALFARAWLRLGLTMATRHGRYDRAVKALLPHAIAQPFVLVILIARGHDPFLAFVLSDVAGQSIAAAGVCLSEARAFRDCCRLPFRIRHIVRLALRNIRLPTINLTATVSAFLFAVTPLFFLPSLANGILGGTLALLFRLLEVPANLTSSSLSPILMKEVADRGRNGILRGSPGTFLLPAAVAATVFVSISLFGLTINSLKLAPTWHLALTILPVVALFQASIAATGPLIDIATLAGRQKGLFALNTVAVGLACVALLLWRHDPIFALLMAGMIGFARVVVMTFWLAGTGRHVGAAFAGVVQPAVEYSRPAAMAGLAPAIERVRRSGPTPPP